MAGKKRETFVCPLLEKDCFAKRGHRGVCYFLTEPALHTKKGRTDCALRKVHRDKSRDWQPHNQAEKEWSDKDKQRTLYS